MKITGIISHGNKSKVSLVLYSKLYNLDVCFYTDLFVLSPFTDFLLVEGRCSCFSGTVSSQDSSELSPTIIAGLPRAKRAWDRAPYSWHMVNLFSFGCHVIDRAYVRTYASTHCRGGVGETIKRKGGVSQACLGKSTFLI